MLTVKSPPALVVPAVWVKSTKDMAPVPAKVPPLCVKLVAVVAPALLSVPPVTARLSRDIPPAATFKEPPATVSEPAEPRLSMETGPNTAGATAGPAKVTFTPAGRTTFATLARSGTAPPAQLAGSNQLLLPAPPVQVTEARRVISAVVVVFTMR